MASLGETVFAFFFKYRPATFQEGQLAFTAPWPFYVVAAVALLALVPAGRGYLRGPTPAAAAGRLALLGLRTLAVLLLAACLLQPALLVSTAVPQRNFVAVLLDDSRSMRIPDVDGRPRSEFLLRAVGGPDSSLRAALAERFQLRFFRFAGDAGRADPAGLGFAGEQSRLDAAVEQVRRDMAHVPLAGIVVLSDGARAAAGAAPPAADPGPGAPVFTVGVGAERHGRDLELVSVSAPRMALRGSSVAVDAQVAHSGYPGATVRLVAEVDGRIAAERELELPPDESAVTTRLHVPVGDAGPRALRVRVVPPPPGDEPIRENNSRELLLAVSDRPARVLYVEGEPRFELKFVRRAVAGDPDLRLVALQRTARDKFLRLGVEDSLDLLDGFPRTREELFAYQGVVLGSIEAGFFSVEQLRMLADFVAQRGGGLLALGGRRALGEGGYAGTALADALPLSLGPADSAERFTELRVTPTAAGAGHEATQIAASEAASAERWRELPALSAVNRAGEPKPGATVLLSGRGEGGEAPVLAVQRFGRGRAAAFPVQDSWIWQMHADVSVDDPTHETFWRQLLRWLASGAPDPVTVATSADRVAPGEPVALHAEVRDSAFRELLDAAVIARIEGPDGAEQEVPLAWSVETGDYRGSFTPSREGRHVVRVVARAGDRELGGAPVWLDAGPVAREFVGATMQADALRRLAEATGGRFYTPATIGTLPDDIAISGGGTTVVRRLDLWDMPAVFLLLLLLVSAEWLWRRARGLA